MRDSAFDRSTLDFNLILVVLDCLETLSTCGYFLASLSLFEFVVAWLLIERWPKDTMLEDLVFLA
jgi:hypothetical protein